MVNSTEEDFDATELEFSNLPFEKIYAISRKNGRKKEVKYQRIGNYFCIKTKNEHLTTQTFILE